VATSFFYTAPPVKLVHRGIGEIFVGLNFGTLMTLGAYYVQTRELSWAPVIASLPVAVLILLVLYINEFQDYNADKTVGKLHWVARMGRRNASKGYAIMLSSVYFLTALGVITGTLSKWSLAAFLTLPLAVKAIKIARREYDNPSALTPANALTIQLHLIIGSILTIAHLLPWQF
jgi:1,4-dihydroxy-2-naphthoate octaprenyltransferase